MQVRSYAKINWALRVTGRRADGFHDLETLFQTIGLHDTLTLDRAPGLKLRCSDPTLPTDGRNLVIRAARALGADDVAITLEKAIPAGGGLGGGSSNAAATLLALDEMFGLGTSEERLAHLALALGSDVPFFLVGGTAYATGRGEQLTPMQSAAPIPLLLLLPAERVSTADAFRRLRSYSPPIGIERYRSILADGILDHASELTNDFEEPIFALLPRLGELKGRLLRAGAAWAGMSGSGSTMVGAFHNQAQRDAAVTEFEDVRAVRAETLQRT